MRASKATAAAPRWAHDVGMALEHARPLDVIDLNPLGVRLPESVSTSLLKTDALQLMRLVLPPGGTLPAHSVPGAITVQCLEGLAEVETPSRTCTLAAGQLVMLDGGESHSVRAISASSLLVTILLHTR